MHLVPMGDLPWKFTKLVLTLNDNDYNTLAASSGDVINIKRL